jgi:hypothetical protein
MLPMDDLLTASWLFVLERLPYEGFGFWFFSGEYDDFIFDLISDGATV